MPSNAELIKRADLALGDLSSNGGLLTPEQNNTFIDYILDEPTLLKQVRTVRMNGPEMKINSMGFGSRIMRAASQTGSAADNGSNSRYVLAADRSKPSTSQVELSTSEVIAEVRLPYEVLEDNIEGKALETHLIRQIAQRASLDLEELALWANESIGSTDPYLDLFNGWMALASAHSYDHEDAGINADLFPAALLQLPQKYLKDMAQLKAFISHAHRIQYMQYLQNRGTQLGDAALQGTMPLRSAGLTVEASPMMANGPASAVGEGLITNPKNLIWGIQRNITLETDKDIRSREHIIVITARVAVEIDVVDATVRIEDIGGMGEYALPVSVVNTVDNPVNTLEVTP